MSKSIQQRHGRFIIKGKPADIAAQLKAMIELEHLVSNHVQTHTT